jgi:hypothetical protein
MSYLIKHIVKSYINTLKGCIRAYGIFSLTFLKWLILCPVYLGILHFTLFLDNIIFPKYRKFNLKEPIFILGHPRSGTTLLHGLLAESDDVVTFKSWETKFPALSTRAIVQSLVNILVKLKKDVILPKSTGHEIRLNSAEGDDMLLTHLLDTMLVMTYTPIIFSQEVNKNGFNVLHDFQDHRDETARFLKNCFKRQAFYKKKNRILSKMAGSILRIQTLYKAFPDAKFIYLMRSPLESIPSYHSLVKKNQQYILFKPGMQEEWYENWLTQRGIDKKLITEKMYEVDLLIYKHIHHSLEQGKIPKEQILEINYQELTHHLKESIQKIADFTGITFSEVALQKIDKRAEKQREYKRAHQVYSFAELNLSEERIKADFNFFFTKNSPSTQVS